MNSALIIVIALTSIASTYTESYTDRGGGDHPVAAHNCRGDLSSLNNTANLIGANDVLPSLILRQHPFNLLRPLELDGVLELQVVHSRQDLHAVNHAHARESCIDLNAYFTAA